MKPALLAGKTSLTSHFSHLSSVVPNYSNASKARETLSLGLTVS